MASLLCEFVYVMLNQSIVHIYIHIDHIWMVKLELDCESFFYIHYNHMVSLVHEFFYELLNYLTVLTSFHIDHIYMIFHLYELVYDIFHVYIYI